MAAITGYGAVSSLGRGAGRIWAAMAEGRDGLAPITRFPADVAFAGMVPGAPVDTGPATCAAFALAAAREAWAHAGLDRVAPARIALVFGSSLGDSDVAIQQLADALGEALGVRGPRIAVTTACASSANALGLGLDLIRLGAADAVIAGGADALTPLVLAGFAALGVLAERKCAPFSEPAGTTLGEGAGFVVLERDGQGPALLGYGLAADGYHDTGPDPSGAGVARAMRSALRHAGVAAVDYVNAHGTGTRANDPAEWRAIAHVLGDRVPVSSSKRLLGHAQGAAGVLELIATLLAMANGAIPQTLGYTVARPNSPIDPVAQAMPRAARCETAMANSAGFGGASCSLVVGRGAAPLHATRRIALVGLGNGGALDPRIDPRGLDATTRLLAAAIAGALEAAKTTIGAADRERSGLVVGQAVASRESDVALQATIAQHGYRGLSASLFARQVVNAAPGACARMFGLRGAHSVVSSGASTALLAIVYAADLLAHRAELARMVAAEVDEAVGASAIVLAAGPGAIEVAGWSYHGEASALAMAGIAGASRFASIADALAANVAHALITCAGMAACAVVLSRGATP